MCTFNRSAIISVFINRKKEEKMEAEKSIWFKKVAEPFGWMGDMATYLIELDSKIWKFNKPKLKPNKFYCVNHSNRQNESSISKIIHVIAQFSCKALFSDLNNPSKKKQNHLSIVQTLSCLHQYELKLT